MNNALFFDDDLGVNKRKAALRVPPPIPDTGWLPPREFPRLDGATLLGVDTETKDLNLLTRGPGWGRKDGHIVGVSVGAIDSNGNRGKWYFPVRHEVETQYNLDPGHVFNWLRDAMATNQPKIGANLLYDVGWLREENVILNGELHDVQFAESLLCEAGEVNLEHLGRKYVNAGKDSSLMYQWLAATYGGNVGPEQRANIYRCSPRLVGFYAESDADLPISVLPQQWPLMAAEGLLDVYRMECDLIPLYVEMRRRGVAVDVRGAEQLHAELRVTIKELYAQLERNTGVKIESVGAPSDLVRVFDACGVPYPRTEAGNPSFQKKWFEALDHPLGDAINEIREHEKIRGTFLQSYILEGHKNGIVHGSFEPLRSDDAGARSGRLASRNPNLQNIPVRTKLGKKIRHLFVPHAGCRYWRKFDYSQIEYRGLVHFAVGKGADDVRRQYNSDPTTDYHKLTQTLVKQFTGLLIERKPIKNINFGLLYGMGLEKLARQLGISVAAARKIMTAYHEGNPYIKATMDWASQQAQEYGYVQTIMGRRSRFDMWEPEFRDYAKELRPLPLDMALRSYGSQIKRSHTHKSINRVLQGSAADMMKLAMWHGLKGGVYDDVGYPMLTVHDELDFSDDGNKDSAFLAYQKTMENCMPLRVPILVDMDIGKNWGDCESLEDLKKDKPDDSRIAYLENWSRLKLAA